MILVAYDRVIKVKNADGDDVQVFSRREEFQADRYQKKRGNALVAHKKSSSGAAHFHGGRNLLPA